MPEMLEKILAMKLVHQKDKMEGLHFIVQHPLDISKEFKCC